MSGEIALYLLSALIVILGGISLVLQKVYKVDEGTGEKTVVEVPIFGKLSTNYPALAFVFVGAALGAFTLNKTFEAYDKWVITGKFRAPNHEAVDWKSGVLSLSPKKYNPVIREDGSFEIVCDIKKGRKFEDVVKQINYLNCSQKTRLFNAAIIVEREYEMYQDPKRADESLIDHASTVTRQYKDIKVEVATHTAP